MSLINQVLNELEKRGADVPLGETTVRAVPPRGQRKIPLLLIVGVMGALVMLGTLKWYLGHRETSGIERPVAVPAAGEEVALAPSAPPPAIAASGPGSVSTEEVSATIARSADLGMSYELSAIPVPAVLRDKPQPEVDQEEEPIAAPKVKKTAPHKPEHRTPKVAGRIERLQAEDAMHSPLKKISPQQHAENEFSKANLALQEGRTNDALAGYEGVLRLEPKYHPARRALVGVLLEQKRNADAERVLQEGLQHDVRESSFAMLLARLQVERNAEPLALETLQKSLPYAEQRADYQAFVAALLQRQNRHKEAVTHFQIALQIMPNNGIWLMGLGISMQALERNEDARDAYRRALASNSLNAQLQAYVQKRLKEL